jgi:DUF3048 family protein
MIDRRRLRSMALVLAAVAAVAACSTSKPASPSADQLPLPSSTPSAIIASPPASTTAPAEPLTGLPGSADGAAVAVPIDLGADARGLADADIVSAEFDEHGLIHAVAIFQAHVTSKAGPLALIRPSDLKLVSQTNPLIAQTGSPAGFLDTAKSVHLTVRSPGRGSHGFTSSGGSDYVDIDSLRASVKGMNEPAPMFQYADPGQPVSLKDVSTAHKLVVKVSGHTTMTWTYDASKKQWLTTISGIQVATTNVVVMTTPYITKHISALRQDLTYANPLGSGKSTVLAGDGRISATWYKKNFSSALNLIGPDQNPPSLLPGSTWILLVPSKSTVSSS